MQKLAHTSKIGDISIIGTAKEHQINHRGSDSLVAMQKWQ
jgi:hypothetical protein